MKMVFVRFSAVQGTYARVYHRPTCWTLNVGMSAAKEIPWKEAFDRGIAACLLCHRFKIREFVCPIDGKKLDPCDLDGQLALSCPCGFLILQALPDE